MRRLHVKQRRWLTSDRFPGAVATSLTSATFTRGIVLLKNYAGLHPRVSLFALLGCSPSFGSSSCVHEEYVGLSERI